MPMTLPWHRSALGDNHEHYSVIPTPSRTRDEVRASPLRLAQHDGLSRMKGRQVQILTEVLF